MQLPKGFIRKYQKLMGNHAKGFLQSFDRSPTQGFRINPLKAHRPVEETLDNPIPWAKWGYYGKVPGRTVDHQSGAVYDQEPSAMYVGTVTDPQPDEKVLDLCAAPGSKTTYLASLMNNQGLLVANEIIPKRAKVLASNLERFGVKNALTLNEPPHKMVKSFKRYFDKILVDAPCSGEGMFRKNPQAIKYWSAGYPAKCAERQRKILAQAVKMLKPGGTLVYSTCTFAPEEDEQTIAWLLKNYNFKTIPVKKYPGMLNGQSQWADGNPELKNAVRIFPNRVKGEGHFIAKLKNHIQGHTKKIKTQRSNVPRRDRDLWNQF
ncbi:MAG: NOL1/NOP2/sun family putative RNA methylase [Acetilactobacillus jinshanensis]